MIKNCYEHIVDINNIKEAYLDIVRQFEEKNKIYSYSGFDGKSVGQYDLFSEKLINEIKEELLQFKPVDPAFQVFIQKRNKSGKRSVYIHSIKERIKAQAVYRILEPIFDTFFSRFLYSYRSSHPHYKALQTIVRRYYKDKNGYMVIGDISNYSDIISPDILKEKIKQFNFDKETQKVIDLYINALYIDKGEIIRSSGIITGLPVMILFNNLYLDEFDKNIGSKVNLYRRVGDDFIMFDTEDKLKKIKEEIHPMLEQSGIKLEFQKINFQRISEDFSFLGYFFSNGNISILSQSVKNIQIYVRSKLKFNKHMSLETKKRRLKKILFEGDCIRCYFIQLVRQYNHVNDMDQIGFISEYFFKRLTIYFFGSYSSRNHRKTIEITQDINMPSFVRYYVMYHTGKVSGKKLKYI